MTIQITVSKEQLDWLRKKFDISNEEDLTDAVWECISTYMEL